MLLLLSLAAWWRGRVEFSGRGWQMVAAVCGGERLDQPGFQRPWLP